jgi:nitrate/TMAO reductase-like tetraheme cytochrome c subunit
MISAVRGLSVVALAAAVLTSIHARAARPIVATEGTQPGGLASAAPVANIEAECKSCHAGGVDDDGVEFRPYGTWAGTMMANAMRDPLFLAALTVSEQDAPGSGAYCIRCHSPKGFVKGNATGIGAALDEDDMEGVECEGCHRSIDASVDQPALEHDGQTIAGLAAFDSMAPYIGNARLIWDPRDVRHGPYSEADSPAHAASPNTFSSSSEFCGQCHEVLSPAKNLLTATGADTGLPFPLDTTYTEWKHSDYAAPGSLQSCIDCHMPRANGIGLTLSTFANSQPRDNPRMHLFAGGNEWGIAAVRAANPELAIAREAAFDAAAKATRALLERSVELALSADPVAAGATSVNVKVRVTNLAGHKFPTGYADGRRAFLQVELLDSGGQSLGLIGKYDDETQRLVAHDDLRIWESVQAEHLADGGHHEWHIVKNDTVLKDTRIPPKGFKPVGAALTLTQPIGADFGPAEALRHYDDVTLHFAALAPLAAGPLKVVARVFYQSTVRELIEELERANVTDDRGRKLKAIWEQTGKAAPRLIETQSLDFMATATGGAGAGGSGMAGGGPLGSGGVDQPGTGGAGSSGAPSGGIGSGVAGASQSGGSTSTGGGAIATGGMPTPAPASGCSIRSGSGARPDPFSGLLLLAWALGSSLLLLRARARKV